MRIGIDIDGVLTNIEEFQLEKGKVFFNMLPKNRKGYEIAEIFDVTEEEDDYFWTTYLYKYAIEEKAREHASEVIEKLKKEGNEIYIITARYLTTHNTKLGKQMRNIVKNWLKENNIEYDEIIFAPEDKLETCKKNKIDIMIEDKVNNIVKISTEIPVICFHAGYNEHIIKKNITRVYDWRDIYNKIKNLNAIKHTKE